MAIKQLFLRHSFFTSLFFSSAILMSEAPLAKTSPDTENAEDLYVVDCLLPGKVKKLGRNARYIAARRPIKTSASDCEIRGGEYVAFDRSDYRTALKIWLPQAKLGDEEAQTYVGEIYEKGLGVDPNYELAAEWYRRAAEQGYSPAQVNLGYLYEKGLGVEQDSEQALSWYRKASGLPPGAVTIDSGTIPFGSTDPGGERATSGTGEPVRDQQQAGSEENKEIARLQRELAQRDADLEALQEKLDNQAGPAPTEETTTNRAIDGPLIEIIDPPIGMQGTRGFGVVEVEPSVRQRDIIGRLMDPANLLSFTVNDRTETVGDDGLFRATVTLRGARTPVRIVAINKQGKRRSVEFQLKPEEFEAAEKVAPVLKFGNYYALLIGNQEYSDWPPLQTPEKDVEVAAKILKEQYGFKTKVMLNATRFEILQALNEYRKKLTENDNFLLYYAGHGQYEDVIKRGYWVPIDGQADSNANWIATFAITDALSAMSAKHILVISDSCYSGALTRSSVAARLEAGRTEEAEVNRLRVIAGKVSRTVLASGDLQPVLDAGSDDHSLFAKAFLDVLRENTKILEGMNIWLEIRALILYAAAAANIEQDPQYAPLKYSGHSGGDFLFVPKALQ